MEAPAGSPAADGVIWAAPPGPRAEAPATSRRSPLMGKLLKRAIPLLLPLVIAYTRRSRSKSRAA